MRNYDGKATIIVRDGEKPGQSKVTVRFRKEIDEKRTLADQEIITRGRSWLYVEHCPQFIQEARRIEAHLRHLGSYAHGRC